MDSGITSLVRYLFICYDKVARKAYTSMQMLCVYVYVCIYLFEKMSVCFHFNAV